MPVHAVCASVFFFGGLVGAIESFLSTMRGHEGELALAFWTTLRVCVLGWLLAMLVGTVLAVMRTSPLRPLRAIATGYVELLRNIPLLVIIVFFFFGLPKAGVVMSGFKAGIIALGLYTGAFTGEAIRAGILAVDRGQAAAARSLGLSGVQTLRYVVLPQAFIVVLAPLGNLTIAMVKNSALVQAIGVADITLTTDKLADRTARTFEFFGAAILLYLLLTVPLAYATRRLEQRTRGMGR
jgi:His/Glu/Gln/Arg/opine family amino acid ABC transporter permease subunit